MSSFKTTINNTNQKLGTNFSSTIGGLIGGTVSALYPLLSKTHKGLSLIDRGIDGYFLGAGGGALGNWIDKKTGLTKHLAPKMFIKGKYEDLIEEYFKIKNTELPQAEIRGQIPRINMLRNRLAQLQQQISIIKNQIDTMK